jgi:hypothetical protein
MSQPLITTPVKKHIEHAYELYQKGHCTLADYTKVKNDALFGDAKSDGSAPSCSSSKGSNFGLDRSRARSSISVIARCRTSDPFLAQATGMQEGDDHLDVDDDDDHDDDGYDYDVDDDDHDSDDDDYADDGHDDNGYGCMDPDEVDERGEVDDAEDEIQGQRKKGGAWAEDWSTMQTGIEGKRGSIKKQMKQLCGTAHPSVHLQYGYNCGKKGAVETVSVMQCMKINAVKCFSNVLLF